jgi:hypothetical protein
MLHESMSYVRQFAPHVLAAVRFAGGPGTEELIAAIGVLCELYATGTRKVPSDTPTGFVPVRWAGYRPRSRWPPPSCTALADLDAQLAAGVPGHVRLNDDGGADHPAVDRRGHVHVNDLISRTTRGLFRDLMTGSTVGEIGAAFQDQLFVLRTTCPYQDSSVRRTLTQE